ncbi:MAG: FAD synthase [Nitrososphaerota archaeon]|nr:FAD synthase [Nitrososphaerota archaeon]MDG7048636.1 FAD synthase [Nitrososphaerota archaeon]MDG7051135.1 FAD synthase [Nitrososphaerota archaeon]
MNDRYKRILAKVYISNLGKIRLKQEPAEGAIIKHLIDEGYLKSSNGSVYLTPLGRSMIRVVFTGGVFDVIHPGHIHTLKTAKSKGDVLVVSVARQANVLRFKNKIPIHDEKLRLELVQSVKFVDLAILGDEKDIMKTVELIKPDIIVLGYDQSHREEDLVSEGQKRGLKFEVKRLTTPHPHIKTRNIIADPKRLDIF